ncbi:unnamed protein product [Prorocentrum cordatum]|uniref:Secreted protein n=1 Tax=Prorocentrum cordatum TaxID=2364126 RepID=A0ABN9WN93_9DINO|nr:unnamed protein product [Polarella glacialis]
MRSCIILSILFSWIQALKFATLHFLTLCRLLLTQVFGKRICMMRRHEEAPRVPVTRRRLGYRRVVKITVHLLPGSVQMSCRAIDLSVELPGTGPVPMTMQLLFGGNSNGSRKRSFGLGSRRPTHANFEWEFRVPRRRRVLRRMLAVGKARGTAETGGGQGRRLRQF